MEEARIRDWDGFLINLFTMKALALSETKKLWIINRILIFTRVKLLENELAQVFDGTHSPEVREKFNRMLDQLNNSVSEDGLRWPVRSNKDKRVLADALFLCSVVFSIIELSMFDKNIGHLLSWKDREAFLKAGEKLRKIIEGTRTESDYTTSELCEVTPQELAALKSLEALIIDNFFCSPPI